MSFDPSELPNLDMNVELIERAVRAAGGEEDSETPYSGPLWHYTSVHAVEAILRSGVMWASDADYLNDFSELRSFEEPLQLALSELSADADDEGRELLGHIWEDFRLILRTTYVLSFSRREDDLSQWRTYGSNGAGAALLLDAEVLNSRKERVVIEEGGDSRGDAHLKECQYPADDEKAERCRNLLSEAFACLDGTKQGRMNGQIVVKIGLMALAPHTKTRAFASEAEVRLYNFQQDRWRTHDDTASYPGRHARLAGDTLIPYVEVDVRDALKGVVLGPLHQYDAPRKVYGMRTLVTSTGYGALPIWVSALPFRRE